MLKETKCRLFKMFKRYDSGVSLLETLVGLAVLGVVAVTFLGGIGIISRVTILNDQRATAENIARSQIEAVKNAAYLYDITEYTPAQLPDGKDYVNYSVEIAAQPLHNPDDGIQKITVTVKYSNNEVVLMESYKVDR